MKNKFAILFVIILLALSLGLGGFSQDEEITLTTEVGEVLPDGFELRLVCAQRICGLQFEVEYDSSSLELATEEPAFEGVYVTRDSFYEGRIICTLADPQRAAQSLVKLRFEILNESGDMSVKFKNIKVSVARSDGSEDGVKYITEAIKDHEYSYTPTLSSETGCKSVIVMAYKSESDREKLKNGREYVAKSRSDGTYYVSNVDVQRPFFKVDALAEDEKASVVLSRSKGKLSFSGTTRITITVIAQNGEREEYKLEIGLEKCEHKYVKIAGSEIPPTCTEDGSYMEKCEVCKSITEHIVESTGHEYKSERHDATCVQGGYVLNKCEKCADEYRTEEVQALGHKMKLISGVEECMSRGKHVFECSECGAKEEKAGEYEVYRVEPTCTTSGFNNRKCLVCGEVHTDMVINPKGHVFLTINTVAPTCTLKGYVVEECQMCGHTAKNELYDPDKDNHNFSRWHKSENGDRERVCLECGLVQHEPSESTPATTPDKSENTTLWIMVVILSTVVVLLLIVIVIVGKRKRKTK